MTQSSPQKNLAAAVLRAIVAAALIVALPGPSAQARCGAPDGVEITPFKPQNASRVEVGQSYDEIVARGWIEIGLYEDNAPYSWGEGDRILGVDAALARIVAQELGVEARLRLVAAGETVDADLRNWVTQGPIVSGRVVNVMMRVPYHADFACRNELAVIGGQYHTERIALAWREEAFPEGAPTPAHFRYDLVAVENDSLAEFYLSRFADGQAEDNIRRYPTMAQAMDALAAGEVKAAMGPLAQLQWGMREASGLRAATMPLNGLSQGQWTVGVAVRHTYRQLGYAVGDAILAAIEDGRLAAIYAEYGLDWSPPEW